MRFICVWLLSASLFNPAASAAGDIILRTAAEPAQAWVGQRVVLQLDVLGADGWTQIRRFGDVDLPGAYLVRTDSQGTRLQETIDGVSYTGQRYEVSVYPQIAGEIRIPALPVEVEIKNWGTDTAQPSQQKLAPAVTIHAKVPPGGEGIRGLVSTTQLTAAQEWTPVTDQPQVGDALQRTVSRQAADVAGMAFAPLQYPDLPGVGIYPAEPEVEDIAARGAIRGRRTDTVTYVFERADKVQLPALQVTWWNLSTQQLETVTLPGRELAVVPGPAGSAGGGLSVSHRMSVRDIVLGSVGLLIAVVLLLRYGRPLARRWIAWRRRRQESEASYFKRAISSVRSKNARLALRDILRWLDRINEGQRPAQLQTFVRLYGDRGMQVVIDRLLSAVGTDGHLSDPAPLIRVMTTTRTQWREASRKKRKDAAVLPDLNG